MSTKIRWCKTCVETDTRPGTTFDENGICQACRNVSKTASETIDWHERNRKLQEIVAWAKSRNVSGYDCIIGVSGGKDSTRQALFAREIGLKPLLVCYTYPPEQQTNRGMANVENLVSLGFDMIRVAPAPGTSKELMRFCFRTYGNMFNASELTLFSSLPITATAFNIPLVLLGENPAIAFGGNVGSLDYDGNRMKYMNTLQGGDPRRFTPPSIPNKEIYWYHYPTDEELERARIKIVYIGYFMSDFNDHTNAKVSIEHGLKIREGRDAEPENMGGIQPYIALDDDLVIANQMMKYLKLGFGKAGQEVGVAIRHGLMTRAEGIEVLKKIDGKCADFYIERTCNYLGMSEKEFWEIADRFVNQDLFERGPNGKWKLKYEIR